MTNGELRWGARAWAMVEVSSAQPQADPVWVDITSYVLAVPGITARSGRQSELKRVDPGVLSLTLNNNDDRFTPGNPNSPYVAWWKQGRRIRVREKIGPWVHDLFDGYLQLPQAITQVEGADQKVTITAVDWLGRLEQARPFVSTLAQHILDTGGSDLRLYWPMGETDGIRCRARVGSDFLIAKEVIYSDGAVAVDAAEFFAMGAGPSIDADDAVTPQWLCNLTTAGAALAHRRMEAVLAPTLTCTSSTVTFAGWVYRDTTNGISPNGYPIFASGDDSSPSTSGQVYFLEATPGVWQATFVAGASSAALSLSAPRPDGWSLVALQMTVPSGAVKAWVDNANPVTGTLSGSPPSSAYFNTITLAQFFEGSIGHVQIYIGTSYDTDMHRAQYAQGFSGLARQRTGDRVNTVLDYAGVPTRMRLVDPGEAVMAQASLASQTPKAALDDAVDTERGVLYVDGSGRVVFQDRLRRYNL